MPAPAPATCQGSLDPGTAPSQGLLQPQPPHQGGLGFSTPQRLPWPRSIITPAGLPKVPGASNLYKGGSHTRPLLLDQERYLFCLTDRNKSQTKWGDKEICPKWKNKIKSQEKNLNETEISNLPDKVFKEMVTRMLTELRRRIRTSVRTSTKT